MDANSTNSTFVVKYLGFRTTSHLWGIKYTRNPVDEMVKQAKLQLSSDKHPLPLPLMKLQVTNTGIQVSPMPQNQNPSCPTGKFQIETISYGVQDIVYTRVFAMIVVNDKQKMSPDSHPFRCHAFVCDSRETARNLTIALASAFEVYSKKVKGNGGNDGTTPGGLVTGTVPGGRITPVEHDGRDAGTEPGGKIDNKKKKFTIDLRTPEEIRREDCSDGTLGPHEEIPDFSEA